MEVSQPGRFDLDALKRQHRLSAVVAASGVALRPTGTTRYQARCPFHDDHQPSFRVVDDGDRGHFHCFGCHAHGDVIDFVMRRDQVAFVEACRRLGAAPGKPGASSILFRANRYRPRWDRRTLDQQLVMNLAGAIYRQGLWQESRALAYVRGRGLPDWLIRQSALGYADGHSLEDDLRRRGCLRVAQGLGLLRRAGTPGIRTEFLEGRLIIPELRGGQFVWFIGRRLDDDGAAPRYLALPGERPILGYERVAGRREVFLCEGIFDLLTAIAWHLPAFSPGGTVLSDEQLGFLARTRTIYGVLDGDDAGRAAAERLGAQLGARRCPLALPEGRDLNDLARQPEGRRHFFALLASARARRRPNQEKADGTPPRS